MSREARSTLLTILGILATVALIGSMLLGVYLIATRPTSNIDYVALAQAVSGDLQPPTPLAAPTTIEDLPLDDLQALTARNNAIADYYESVVARIEATQAVESPVSPPVAIAESDNFTLTCRNGHADLNIRSQPRRTARRLGQIPPNALLKADWNDLQFDSAGNPWLPVRYEDETGIVEGYAQYLNQSDVYLISAVATNCAQDFEAQFG